MILEVRIRKKIAEVHVIDGATNHPISIVKSNLDGLNSLLFKLMNQYRVNKIKRNRKPMLTA